MYTYVCVYPALVYRFADLACIEDELCPLSETLSDDHQVLERRAAGQNLI